MLIWQRIYWAGFYLSAALLIFLAGFLTAAGRIFPYEFFRRAFMEMAPQPQNKLDPFRSDLYSLADSPLTGVIRYDPDRAYNGYTLFSSSHTYAVFLIDMQGRIVYQWDVPCRGIGILVRNAHLYANGDLLAVCEDWGPFDYGYRLVKLDRNSRVIWSYPGAHHHVEVGPDGRIYTLIHKVHQTRSQQAPSVRPPWLEGFVVVLSSDGRLLKKVSVNQAFLNSRYRDFYIGMLKDCIGGDVLHTNSVKVPAASFLRMFPSASPNTVLISVRDLDSIALLDLDSEKIVWVLHGPFARQHDPDFLPNGKMMIFDDLGDPLHYGDSRVLEFEPNGLTPFGIPFVT